jgi:hypothetical protein
MILVKENIVQLAHIYDFATPAALVKVPFLRFAQLVKVSGIHLVTRVQESSMTS